MLPGPRLEDRRGIEVTDAQPREIRNDARRVIEREFAIELHAIGGARDLALAPA